MIMTPSLGRLLSFFTPEGADWWATSRGMRRFNQACCFGGGGVGFRVWGLGGLPLFWDGFGLH